MRQIVQNELAALANKLREKMLDKMAFSMAVKLGYIVVREDGHMQWMLENKTLLAYFCGRLWCGDSSHYSCKCRAKVWDFGSARFPEKALAALFGVKNIRIIRIQRELCPLPAGWERVEKIFEDFRK